MHNTAYTVLKSVAGSTPFLLGTQYFLSAPLFLTFTVGVSSLALSSQYHMGTGR